MQNVLLHCMLTMSALAQFIRRKQPPGRRESCIESEAGSLMSMLFPVEENELTGAAKRVMMALKLGKF